MTEKVVIFCADLSEFISFVVVHRQLPEKNVNFLVKVGMDGRGGSMKLCLNLSRLPDCTSPSNSPLKKKQPKDSRFLDSGVKRLFTIAIGFGIQENYSNVKTLLGALELKSISFSLACDLKLANLLVGIQNHASTHPCAWCVTKSPTHEAAAPRTLDRIRLMFKEFNKAGRIWNKAQKFENCINEPLLDGEDETEILDVIPPPELHLMLGAVNRIFDALNSAWGDDNAYKWASKNNITQIGYHGGCLEGNKCSLLLKKMPDLVHCVPDQLKKFAWALHYFDKMKKACFSAKLMSNYSEKKEKFQKSCMDLGIPVTPKIHVICSHVKEFCDRKGHGLELYSEQASESVHHDFQKTWERFKVPEGHDSLEPWLLRAVTEYNSFHL